MNTLTDILKIGGVVLVLSSPIWFAAYREAMPVQPEFARGDAVSITGGINRGETGVVRTGFMHGIFVRRWHYMIKTVAGDVWADDYEIQRY